MRLIDADAFLAENCADRLFYDSELEMGVASCDECNHHCLEIDCDRIMDAPIIDAVPVVRCNQCKHYDGVHGVTGCAPCTFWGIGAVMWDDFCKRGERWKDDGARDI